MWPTETLELWTGLEAGQMTVKMDGKADRTVTFKSDEFRQFDHGYAVTSHSSQGLTTTRVLANIDTDSSRSLINTRLAYVAISRASEDARVYTNDAGTLGQRLATDITKTAAIDFRPRAVVPGPRSNSTGARSYPGVPSQRPPRGRLNFCKSRAASMSMRIPIIGWRPWPWTMLHDQIVLLL